MFDFEKQPNPAKFQRRLKVHPGQLLIDCSADAERHSLHYPMVNYKESLVQ